MVAPTVSGITQLVTTAKADGTAVTNISGQTVNTSVTTYGQLGSPSQTSSVIITSYTPASGEYYGKRFALGSVQDLSNKILLWAGRNSDNKLSNFSNGGITIVLYSNAGLTEYAQFTCLGKDSTNFLSSDFIPIFIDPATTANATVVTASYNAATIYAIEMRFYMGASSFSGAFNAIGRVATAPKSAQITLINGDTTTKGAIENFYSYFNTTALYQGWDSLGVSQFRSSLTLSIGDGSTATNFYASNRSLEFPNTDSIGGTKLSYTVIRGLNVNASGGDSIIFERSLISAPTSPWTLNVIGSTSAVVRFLSCTFSNIGTNSLGANALFRATAISGSTRLIPVGATSFISCTIDSSSGTTAAFTWLNTLTITGTSFTNNTTPTAAVRIDTAGTYNLSSNTFSGNTKDFNVTATTGTVTIYVDANSTTDFSGGFAAAGYIAARVVTAGATVVISAPPLFLSVATTPGANVSIRAASNNSLIASGTADGSGNFSATYSGGSLSAILRVRKAGYVPYQSTVSITSAGLTASAVLAIDGNYNPTY